MESLYLLIPVALVFVAVAIRLLLWAIDSGQYEDLDKEGSRILNEDNAAALSRKDESDSAGTPKRGNDK